MESVSLLTVDTYGEQLTERIIKLLEPLGGLARFCSRGDRVLLKPNLIMARTVESAATTHPAIILALVRLLTDLGCKTAIGDSPGIGTAASVLRKLGLEDELRKYQVEVVEFQTPVPTTASQTTVAFERRFQNLHVAQELDDFDRIINLPKLKSHGQMGITLATKNLYGCIVGQNKGRWHFTAGKDRNEFARLLVEIAITVHPVLHILDGIIGMDGNGPSNGRPRNLSLLLASDNPIALDRVVVELIQQKAELFPIFTVAHDLKLAGTELSEITVYGEDMSSCKVKDFEIPASVGTEFFVNETFSKVLKKLINQRLILDRKACIKCRKCEEYCPAKAITYHNQIRIDENQCIKCCCCQELCPVGALEVKDPWFVKLLHKYKLM